MRGDHIRGWYRWIGDQVDIFENVKFIYTIRVNLAGF